MELASTCVFSQEWKRLGGCHYASVPLWSPKLFRREKAAATACEGTLPGQGGDHVCFPPPPRSSSEQLWFFSQTEGTVGSRPPRSPRCAGLQRFLLQTPLSRALQHLEAPEKRPRCPGGPHLLCCCLSCPPSLGFDCVVFAQSLGAVQVQARQSRMRYTQRTRVRTRASSELGSAPGGLPLSRAGALWQAVVSKPHLHKAHLCTHSARPPDVHKG